MTNQPGGLPERMDRLEIERRARAAGLPEILASRVADVVAASDLAADRREEVFRELVAHFEDGLGAGQSAEELARHFGDGQAAARMIREEKRVVTPPELGGMGARDGFVIRVARDLRYAVRRLLARPAFTGIAVLSLALGIGANAAMFTLINEVIFRKPPVERPEELVNIYRSGQGEPFNPLSYPEYRDISLMKDVFSATTALRLGIAFRLVGDRPERLMVQMVSGNYFATLGLKPGRGRLIQEDDAAAPGQSPVVVLSDRYWRKGFGADPNVVGQTIRLSGGEYTVVGIARPDFPGGFPGIAVEVFVPITMIERLMPGSSGELEARGNSSTMVRARMAAGVTMPRVRAALMALGNSLHERNVRGWEGEQSYSVLPSRDVILYPPIDRLLRPIAWVMMGVVGMVLLIACANLAGFLLARAVDRRKEVAIRLAVGAARAQLVFQLLVETLLLALVGGGVGLILGQVALKAVLASDLPIPLPIAIDLTLDARVLTFLILVSVAAGIAFGLAPALQSTRLDLASVIRDESTGGGRSKGLLRRGLVVGQVAVSVVLLIAAGLFVRSVRSLRDVDPGFGYDPTALVWLGAPGNLTLEENSRWSDLLVERFAGRPGITHVGRADNLHLNLLNTSTTAVIVDGVAPPTGQPGHAIDRASIDTGFIAAIGLRLEGGRNFTAEDVSEDRRVAIVNRAFGEKFWPGQNSVGRRFRQPDGGEREIVGLVNNAKVRSLAEPPRPVLYLPLQDHAMDWFVVRGPANAESELAAMLRTVREVEPEGMVVEARTMARHLGIMSLPLQLGANAMAAFALLALVLASIGLYGTVSYSVAQRSREVGIRLALGASAPAVVRLLLWEGLKLVLVGAVLGTTLGFLFGKALEQLLYGVTALDPVALAAVPVVLVLVAAVAAYLPARRAGRVDPVMAMRSD